jgi:GT2 family glycosyltransferase
VLSQQLPRDAFEILFVDNNSSDESVAIVEEDFPSVRLIQFDKNYGFCEGNNRALPFAQGRYIVFLNVDTFVQKHWLGEMLRVMESDSTIKGCHSNNLTPAVEEYKDIDQERRPDRVYYFDLSIFGYVKYFMKPFKERPIPTLFLSGSCLLIDREIFDDLNGVFDPDFFMYGEDMDLALRINSLGYKTVVVPTSVIYHKSPFHITGKLDFSTFQKVNKLMQNRFIVFFKNMYAAEFVLFVPFLICGMPLKMLQLKTNLTSKLTFFFLSIPLNFLAFIIALLKFKRYAEGRRYILKRRKTSKFWLLKKILHGHE